MVLTHRTGGRERRHPAGSTLPPGWLHLGPHLHKSQDPIYGGDMAYHHLRLRDMGWRRERRRPPRAHPLAADHTPEQVSPSHYRRLQAHTSGRTRERLRHTANPDVHQDPGIQARTQHSSVHGGGRHTTAMRADWLLEPPESP